MMSLLSLSLRKVSVSLAVQDKRCCSYEISTAFRTMRGVAFATRFSALALLSSQGGERHYKPGEVRKAREGKPVDNTLEVVTLVSS